MKLALMDGCSCNKISNLKPLTWCQMQMGSRRDKERVFDGGVVPRPPIPRVSSSIT